MHTNKNAKGFTLIELMIVVAIIGILAAIAMPQYNKYVARTQVAEAFALLGPVKQALMLYYQENGEFPQHTTLPQRHDTLGIPRRDDWGSNSNYIWRLVVYTSGTIRIVFKNQNENEGISGLIARKRFELQPNITAGEIRSWRCVTDTSDTLWIDQAYIKSCL